MTGPQPVSRDEPAGYRAFGYVKLAGALVSGVAIFGMMLFIVADVVTRNLIGGSIPGSFEVAENYFLPLAVFPALGYVYASGVLPKMDMVLRRVTPRLRAATVHTLVVLELVIYAVLIVYSTQYAVSGAVRDVAFPAGGSLYPLYPLFFLVPLGVGLMLVETVFVLVRNLAGDTVALAMREVTLR